MKPTTNNQPIKSIHNLAVIATKRETNLFASDLNLYLDQIRESLNGARALVIGGAGSIGSATISQLVRFQLAAIHVVDINENGLAELVRNLRSSKEKIRSSDFRTLPIDFGSPIMQRFLMEEKPYDYVLNFAAIKHVRSEKDIYSILHMLNTNVLKGARLLKWLSLKGGGKNIFAVSTDKAANPVNLMGASKRLMEHVLFTDTISESRLNHITSTRFANVAFSDGSLLQSWINRLEKHQPIPTPRQTRRFFISLEEAGCICLIASLCGPHKQLIIPDFDAENELQEIQLVAERFLRFYGYEPRYYENEDAAKESVESDIQRGQYPLLLTPLDTSGEKDFEEFVGVGEIVESVGLPNLTSIKYKPCDAEMLRVFLELIQNWIDSPERYIDKQNILKAIATVVPEMEHAASDKNLDERM